MSDYKLLSDGTTHVVLLDVPHVGWKPVATFDVHEEAVLHIAFERRRGAYDALKRALTVDYGLDKPGHIETFDIAEIKGLFDDLIAALDAEDAAHLALEAAEDSTVSKWDRLEFAKVEPKPAAA